MKTKLEKAKMNLQNHGVSAFIEFDRLYIVTEDDLELELSMNEVNFRAELYDDEQPKN